MGDQKILQAIRDKLKKVTKLAHLVSIVLFGIQFFCLFYIRGFYDGQICSGDYLTEEDLKGDTSIYDLEKGKFLKVVLIINCFLLILLIIWLIYQTCLVCVRAGKRYGYLSQDKIIEEPLI